jgi:hypothetical protein
MTVGASPNLPEIESAANIPDEEAKAITSLQALVELMLYMVLSEASAARRKVESLPISTLQLVSLASSTSLWAVVV